MDKEQRKPLSDNAQYIVNAGINRKKPHGSIIKVSADEAVAYAIGDLYLKYPQEQKHLAALAVEEIAQLYVAEKRAELGLT